MSSSRSCAATPGDREVGSWRYCTITRVVTSSCLRSPPAPFVAPTRWALARITAGDSTLTLVAQTPDTFTYSSNIKAHGLFRLVFPDALVQSSTFTLADGMCPLALQENGLGRDRSDVVDLSFDRSTGRVHGTAETHPWISPWTPYPGSHVGADRTDAAAAGRACATQFKLFRTRTRPRNTSTPRAHRGAEHSAGALETAVYRSDRPDSDRVTRLWLAPKTQLHAAAGQPAAQGQCGSVDAHHRRDVSETLRASGLGQRNALLPHVLPPRSRYEVEHTSSGLKKQHLCNAFIA